MGMVIRLCGRYVCSTGLKGRKGKEYDSDTAVKTSDYP